MLLAVFSKALSDQTLEDGTTRTFLNLHPALAPIKVAVLPLVKKDGLPEIARKILEELKWDLATAYDEKDAVGRRYRRQDALGTPFCLTIDHKSLEDQTITLRDRNSLKQERVAIGSIKKLLLERVSISNLLKSI